MLPASVAPAERFSQCFPHRQPQRSGKLFRTDFRFDPSLRSAPASNKPHPAEKSTPVWLAIWRIWAGFANSQLLRAAFRCIYLYRYAHSSCSHLGLLLRHSKSLGPSAPIAYATSVSPPNEAVAWPGAAFLQITARANPCSRHLWGTLARAVASI